MEAVPAAKGCALPAGGAVFDPGTAAAAVIPGAGGGRRRGLNRSGTRGSTMDVATTATAAATTEVASSLTTTGETGAAAGVIAQGVHVVTAAVHAMAGGIVIVRDAAIVRIAIERAGAVARIQTRIVVAGPGFTKRAAGPTVVITGTAMVMRNTAVIAAAVVSTAVIPGIIVAGIINTGGHARCQEKNGSKESEGKKFHGEGMD
jgi:hypothetical protein